MPLYRYQALSDEGKRIAGTIDADHLQDAKQKLIRRQIVVIQLAPLSDKELKKPLSSKDILSLTRELARLLLAGLPLFEALSALEEKYREQKPHKILLDLCERVKAGHPFSKALSHHSNTFDLLYISMVSNAEKTGKLAECLDDLSKLIARQQQIRKQILSTLLYPSLLALFCCVVLSSLLFFVVPSLRELFDNRNLHPLTKFVFAASQFACESKMWLLALLSALILTMIIFCCSRTWKKKMSNILLNLPLLKIFFAKVAIARFARAAATLLEGGLPLITAFAQARAVMRHPPLEHFVAKAEEKVAQGESLATSFMNHPLVPPLFPRMLGIAEQSGKLSFIMQQIAQIYEDELETTLIYFSTIAQPALLLFLGGLVGFVLLAVLLPLTDVSSFVN